MLFLQLLFLFVQVYCNNTTEQVNNLNETQSNSTHHSKCPEVLSLIEADVTTTTPKEIIQISDLEIASNETALHISWLVTDGLHDNISLRYREVTSSSFAVLNVRYSDGELTINNLDEGIYYLVCLTPPLQATIDVNCVVRNTLKTSWMHVPKLLVIVTIPGLLISGFVLGIFTGYFYRRRKEPKEPFAVPRPEWTLLGQYLQQKGSSGTPSYISFCENMSRRHTQVNVKPMRKHFTNRSNSTPTTIVWNASSQACKSETQEEPTRGGIETIEKTFDNYFYQYLQLGALTSLQMSGRSVPNDKDSSAYAGSSNGSTDRITKRRVTFNNIYEGVQEEGWVLRRRFSGDKDSVWFEGL